MAAATCTIVPVLLSGGSGTRLWPVARALYPKQLLPMISNLTMFQETLRRFAGGFGFSTDNGFGRPWDYVVAECTAELQFYGRMTTTQGNRVGQVGMDTPPCTGPTGVTVGVIGYGNGA